MLSPQKLAARLALTVTSHVLEVGSGSGFFSAAYESNMNKLIPDFAQQLYEGALPINGVKIVRT
jgi:protein-L-isoaspartate O-methyltransferase